MRQLFFDLSLNIREVVQCESVEICQCFGIGIRLA